MLSFNTNILDKRHQIHKRDGTLFLTWCICCSQANCLGNAVDSLFKSEVLKGELGVLMKNTLPLEKVIILGVIAEGRLSVILAPEEYHTRLHLRCLWKEKVFFKTCWQQSATYRSQFSRRNECYEKRVPIVAGIFSG